MTDDSVRNFLTVVIAVNCHIFRTNLGFPPKIDENFNKNGISRDKYCQNDSCQRPLLKFKRALTLKSVITTSFRAITAKKIFKRRNKTFLLTASAYYPYFNIE